MDVLEKLKNEIGHKAIEIEDICADYGLIAMNNVTVMVRDVNNPNMFAHVSNDPGCFPLVWHDAQQHLPDPERGWALALFRPARLSDYQEPDYYELATYDHIYGSWRSKSNVSRTVEAQVLGWAYLPALGGSVKDGDIPVKGLVDPHLVRQL